MVTIEASLARVVALFGILASIAALTVDWAGRARTDLAERLTFGQVLSVEGRTSADFTLPAARLDGLCRRDIARAAAQIASAQVDAIVEAGKIELVADGIRRLEEAARRALACSPNDGLAWAWLAIAADAGSSASAAEIRKWLELSLWSAPSDLSVIQVRLPQTTRIASRRGHDFDPIIRTDIRTLLASEESAWTIASVMGPAFVWLGEIAQSEFRSIDDAARRESLLQAFGALRANIGACDKDAFNDWLYRGQKGACAEGNRIPDFALPKRLEASTPN